MSDANFHVAPEYQPLMRELALDAEEIFRHPQIKVWRSIPDRENCTLDAQFQSQPIRLHIKRYFPTRGISTPAGDEVRAIRTLETEQIPTVPLVGWGNLPNRRSFIITRDLTGYAAADKLIESDLPFAQILEPTADLAAKLHAKGLHHRDLYLCHFFVKQDDPRDVRLIDVARVRRLGNFLTRSRWITKDLAQFWFSTLAHCITEEQRYAWLKRYAEQRSLASFEPLVRPIARKVRSIARHDEKLRASQPGRNISLPRSLFL